MTGRTVVRRIALGVAAAVAAGALMGASARLMMRLAALAAGHPAEFSLGGTLGILTVFVVVTVPGAVLASLVRRRGRSALLVLLALLLCVPAAGVAGTDLGSLSSLSTASWIGVIAATTGVFVSILALPWVTLRLLAVSERVSGASSPAPSSRSSWARARG